MKKSGDLHIRSCKAKIAVYPINAVILGKTDYIILKICEPVNNKVCLYFADNRLLNPERATIVKQVYLNVFVF